MLTPCDICRIFHILRKPNPIISLFFIRTMWLVFLGDITRALIGLLTLNCRALISCNAHGLIRGLQKQIIIIINKAFILQKQSKKYLKKLLLLLMPYIKKKLHAITSPVRSLRENLKPRPTVLTLLSLSQYGKATVWDFPVTTSLSAIKSWFTLWHTHKHKQKHKHKKNKKNMCEPGLHKHKHKHKDLVAQSAE